MNLKESAIREHEESVEARRKELARWATNCAAKVAGWVGASLEDFEWEMDGDGHVHVDGLELRGTSPVQVNTSKSTSRHVWRNVTNLARLGEIVKEYRLDETEGKET